MYLFLLIKTRRSINELMIERKFCKEYNHWNEIRLLANRLVDDQLSKTRDKFGTDHHFPAVPFSTALVLIECL